MTAEIAYNQPDILYRREAGLNQSSLKKILQSPAHYQAALNQKFAPSAAMEMGTAVHSLVLDGPKAFEGSYFDRGKEGKDLTVAELKEALDKKGVDYKKSAKKAELEGLLYPDGKPVDRRTGLSSDDYATVEGMAKQLSRLPYYDITDDAAYIKRNEVSIYWDWAGVQCKARLDSVLVEEGLIVDLKTTMSVEPGLFMKKVIGLGYDFQASYYSKAAEAAYGKPFRFIFAAVEREAPFNVQLFEVTDEMMAEGMAMCEDALHLYKLSESSEIWEPPVIHQHKLEYPRWRTPYKRRFKRAILEETPLEDIF